MKRLAHIATIAALAVALAGCSATQKFFGGESEEDVQDAVDIAQIAATDICREFLVDEIREADRPIVVAALGTVAATLKDGSPLEIQAALAAIPQLRPSYVTLLTIGLKRAIRLAPESVVKHAGTRIAVAAIEGCSIGLKVVEEPAQE